MPPLEEPLELFEEDFELEDELLVLADLLAVDFARVELEPVFAVRFPEPAVLPPALALFADLALRVDALEPARLALVFLAELLLAEVLPEAVLAALDLDAAALPAEDWVVDDLEPPDLVLLADWVLDALFDVLGFVPLPALPDDLLRAAVLPPVLAWVVLVLVWPLLEGLRFFAVERPAVAPARPELPLDAVSGAASAAADRTPVSA